MTAGTTSKDNSMSEVTNTAVTVTAPPAQLSMFGVWAQKLGRAFDGVEVKNKDGKVIDRQFLPVIYEFPQAMIDRGEHELAQKFYVTNPNLGASGPNFNDPGSITSTIGHHGLWTVVTPVSLDGFATRFANASAWVGRGPLSPGGRSSASFRTCM